MTKPSNAKAYKRAMDLIQQSRQTVEALIDSTPSSDKYRLEVLGPILNELRMAEAAISRLGEPRTNWPPKTALDDLEAACTNRNPTCTSSRWRSPAPSTIYAASAVNLISSSNCMMRLTCSEVNRASGPVGEMSVKGDS